jgi:lysophospholipase L1-like esterase
MKHKIPLCIFLIIIIFLSTISNKPNNYEILTNQNKIILIGDSMLENSNYVKKSVAYNIEKLHGSAPTILATDGATISHLPLQLINLETSNNPNTYIFTSIGGNDILENSTSTKPPSTTTMNNIFNRYKAAIKDMKKKFNKSKIVLLNIYYPPEKAYLHNVVTLWNKKQAKFAKDIKCQILDVTSLNQAKDFTDKIEPSSVGSKKIAKKIINF